MANESLIRGAAMAAPKFNPAAESFQKGFASSFEGISKSYAEEAEKLKALEEKRAKDAEKLYADKPLVQDGEIPSKFRPVFTQASMQLKNEYADLISNKDSMDPLEFIDKQNEYKTRVNDLNKQINSLATWQAGVIEAHGEGGSDNLSQSMTATEQETVQNILDGNYPMENRDGKIGFINPETKEFYSLDDLPTPRVKAITANNELEDQAMKLGMFAGQGYNPNNATFKNSLDTLKRKIDGYSKDQILSLYADFTGLAGPDGVATPEKVDKETIEAMRGELFNHYKKPAEEIAAESYAEYQRRTTPKPTAKYTKSIQQQIDINEGSAKRLFEISEQLAKSGNPEDLLATIKAQKPGTPIFSRQDYFKNEYAIAKAKAEKAKETDKNVKVPTEAEFKKEFDAKYDSSIQIIDKNGSPLKINLKDPNAVYEQILNYSGMNKLVATHFKDLYRNKVVINDVDTEDLPVIE